MSDAFEFKWLQSKRHPKGQEVRLKGGPDSGHHGHAGVPGSVGGSAPSSGTSFGAAGPIVMMMSLEDRVKKVQSNVSGADSEVDRLKKKYRKDGKESTKRYLEEAKQRVVELDIELRQTKADLEKVKDAKAPGIGEWKYDPDTSKKFSGGGTSVQVFTHPEHGTVQLGKSIGLRSQKEPPTADVTFKLPNGSSYIKNWSGQTADMSAIKYLMEHWGIEL